MNTLIHRPAVIETDVDRVVRDTEIYRGKPIVRGTRVPVYLIAGLAELGQTPEEIVDDYPDLVIADVEAAMEYAKRAPETLEQTLR